MNELEQISGIVFNVQKFSVHDGPGIRTLVFLKGCPLHCRWCSNPESQAFLPEIAYNPASCLHCVACAAHCRKDAVQLLNGSPRIDRERCVLDTACLCENVCSGGALFCYGRRMTVGELIRQVERDEIFYSRTGGGLTLGGGEALAQPRFALALLKAARSKRIHIGLETCGFVPQHILLEAAALLDTLYFDLKVMDSSLHQRFTGQPNEMIQANLAAVRRQFPALDITVRTPVIPGVNDNDEEICKIASFVRGLGIARYELLEYHRYGEQKYAFLGRDVPMPPLELPAATFARLKKLANGCG